MSTSRRNFLRHAGTAAICTAAMPLAAIAQEIVKPVHAGRVLPTKSKVRRTGSMDPFYMGTATFIPYLNTTFEVASPTNLRFQLELIGVEENGTSNKRSVAGGKESFTLTFRSDLPLDIRQDVYNFEHSALGNFSLFMAPTKSTALGEVYVIVINHIDL